MTVTVIDYATGKKRFCVEFTPFYFVASCCTKWNCLDPGTYLKRTAHLRSGSTGFYFVQTLEDIKWSRFSTPFFFQRTFNAQTRQILQSVGRVGTKGSDLHTSLHSRPRLFSVENRKGRRENVLSVCSLTFLKMTAWESNRWEMIRLVLLCCLTCLVETKWRKSSGSIKF